MELRDISEINHIIDGYKNIKFKKSERERVVIW